MEISGVGDVESKTVDSKESGVYELRQEDPPTTSNACHLNPELNSHNDLKALDFNSADDIRQAMKMIMSGTPQNDHDVAHCEPLVADKHSILTSPIQTIDAEHIELNGDLRKDISNVLPISRKRPGRPPKAGPSKKIRKINVNDMYLGKLSNVVPFKNNRKRKYSESDTDTYIYY